MANRALDWLTQAEADLNHARVSLAAGDHEWACFAAQQAAEKAVKALLLDRGGEGWGHSVTRLLVDLRQVTEVPEALLNAARRLDRHYIPTRCPNGFDAGAPRDYYMVEDSTQAVTDGAAILGFCQQSLRPS